MGIIEIYLNGSICWDINIYLIQHWLLIKQSLCCTNYISSQLPGASNKVGHAPPDPPSPWRSEENRWSFIPHKLSFSLRTVQDRLKLDQGDVSILKQRFKHSTVEAPGDGASDTLTIFIVVGVRRTQRSFRSLPCRPWKKVTPTSPVFREIFLHLLITDCLRPGWKISSIL